MSSTITRILVLTSLIMSFVLAIDPPGPDSFWGAKAVAGSTVIAGRRMTCGTGKIIIDNEMNAIAQARTGKREIYINKRRLSKYSRTFQQWVFLHECAHMYVLDEAAADCWALRRGYYRGIFNRSSVNQICEALWNKAATNYHFAGPDRCMYLKTCLAKTRHKILRGSKSAQN